VNKGITVAQYKLIADYVRKVTEPEQLVTGAILEALAVAYHGRVSKSIEQFEDPDRPTIGQVVGWQE
jgi:hypothetical protein